jgi:hypothetical protein
LPFLPLADCNIAVASVHRSAPEPEVKMDLLVGIRVNSGLIMAFVGAAVFTVRIQKMVILVVGG